MSFKLLRPSVGLNPPDSLEYQPSNDDPVIYEDPARDEEMDWQGYRRMLNQPSAPSPDNLMRPRSVYDPYGHYSANSQPSNKRDTRVASTYENDQSDIKDRNGQPMDFQSRNFREFESRGYAMLEQLRRLWNIDLNADERQFEQLLRTTEIFLKQLNIGDERFFRELVSSQREGHQVLTRLLHKIQRCVKEAMQQTTEGSVYATRFKLIEQVEYNVLLCFQCLTKFESIRQVLLNDHVAIEVVACGSSNHSFKTSNLVAVQILTELCDGPVGCSVILAAFTTKAPSESRRFAALVKVLNECDDVLFKTWCMKLFNALGRHMKQRNYQMSFRQELTETGLNPELLTQYSGSDGQLSDELEREVNDWKSVYVARRPVTYNAANDIDISSLSDKDVEIRRLREEIEELNGQLLDLQTNLEEWQRAADNWTNSADQWKAMQQDLEQKCNEYRDLALEQKKTATKVTELYRIRMGRNPEDDPQFNDSKPIAKTTSESTLLADLRQTMTNANNAENARTIATIPLHHLRDTVRHKVTNHPNVALLNWTPIASTDSTIFQELNVENIIRELDFSEFDTHFAVTSTTVLSDRNESDEPYTARRSVRRPTGRIEFIEINRAKNMNITLRKIDMTLPDLRWAIERCDTSRLTGESAELLIKFIPTRDEIKRLKEIDPAEYINLAEAELFVYCMSLIDRLEAKLSIMTFIGQYGEVITTLAPNIPLLRSAADSVCCSNKLRALFEVILAFGNYMNTSRKGFVLGFKLDSLAKLSEVKSRINRSITLLHFIVRVIEMKYPQISDFYNEIDIELDRSVSYQAITNAIQVLRHGDDIMREEIRLQPENAWINSFYVTSSPVISQLLADYHDMQDSYRAACDMFGENFRLVEPQELFGPITTFITAYKKALADNNAAIQPRLVQKPLAQAQVKVYRGSVAMTSSDVDAFYAANGSSPTVADSAREQQMKRISAGIFLGSKADNEELSAF